MFSLNRQRWKGERWQLKNDTIRGWVSGQELEKTRVPGTPEKYGFPGSPRESLSEEARDLILDHFLPIHGLFEKQSEAIAVPMLLN